MSTIPTAAEIALLEQAIRQGARRVRYEDREVEYQSLGQMRGELARMKQEAGELTRGPHRRVSVYSSGHGPPPTTS